MKKSLQSQFERLLALPSASERLTKALYEAMYLRGSFIAHFNRQGFHKARFWTLADFDKTIRMMSEVKELRELLENTDVTLISMARFKIAAMECNNLNQQALINLEHIQKLQNQFNKKLI